LEKDPLREGFLNFVQKGFTVSQIHVLSANFVKFRWSEIGKVCVIYWTKNFASLSRSRFCADHAKTDCERIVKIC